jgi:TRAP-type uncharacterized transport system substrate-binding protein
MGAVFAPINPQRSDLMAIITGRDVITKTRPADNKYFYIENAFIKSAKWSGNTDDLVRFKVGNCFDVREDAEAEIAYMVTKARLQNFANANNSKIVWDGRNENYFLLYKHNLRAIDIVSSTYDNYGTIPFSSREIALAAIREIGEEEIIKNYFRIR